MEENDIMFVDFFDVVRHPFTSLVQSLCFIHDSGLLIVAVIVLIVKFLNILFGEGLVIKGYRVFIGAKPSDDLVKTIALIAVDIKIAIIDLFGFHVLLELFDKELTLLFELLLLLGYVVSFDFLQVDYVDLGILFELDRKLPIDFSQVDNVVSFLGGIQTVLYYLLLKCDHFLVDLLRICAG